MASRRDEVLQSLDTAISALRAPFSATQSGSSEQEAPLHGRIQQGLTAAYNSLLGPESAIRQGALGTQTPRQSASHIRSLSDPVSTGPPPPSHRDEVLPRYTRRLPNDSQVTGKVGTSGTRVEGGLKEFRFSSSSGRLHANVMAMDAGGLPFLLHSINNDVSGRLRVELGSDGQAVSEIRIKCKGVVRTLAFKSPSSYGNRVPVQDELVFLQADRSLYTAPPNAGPDFRLTGSHTFPFQFNLPECIPSSNTPLPPSFLLNTPDPQSLTSTIEWASVKYYLKVTLARRGMFRTNERFFVPFVLVMKPTHIPRSPTSLPGPVEDPQSWTGPRARQQVRRGMLRGRSGSYELVCLVPNPPIFDRRMTIPFYLKIVSSDPNLTGDFAPSTVSVALYQRTSLTASKLDSVHENFIAIGTLQPDGPNDGVSPKTPEGWCRRLKGEINLASSRSPIMLSPSFSCPNLIVEYYILASVRASGQGNCCVVSAPINLVARHPLQSAALSPSTAQSSSSTSQPVAEPAELPPSYFEVQEMDRLARRSSR